MLLLLKKEISQSDFIRMALREKAGHVLAGVDSSGLGATAKPIKFEGVTTLIEERAGIREAREREPIEARS